MDSSARKGGIRTNGYQWTRHNKGRVIKFSGAQKEIPGSEKKGCGEGGPEGAGGGPSFSLSLGPAVRKTPEGEALPVCKQNQEDS